MAELIKGHLTEQQTTVGRNRDSILHLSNAYSRKNKVRAWVIGLGLTSKSTHPNSEHVEVALALHKAGVKDYKVYASDINRIVIEEAKKVVNGGRLKVNTTPLLPKTSAQLISQAKYFSKMFGLRNAFKNEVELKLPEKVKHSIVFLGSKDDRSGDVFLSSPIERPDVITCFNVAQHYDGDAQEELALRLADALKIKGRLYTNSYNTAFRKKLEALLGKPKILFIDQAVFTK